MKDIIIKRYEENSSIESKLRLFNIQLRNEKSIIDYDNLVMQCQYTYDLLFVNPNNATEKEKELFHSYLAVLQELVGIRKFAKFLSLLCMKNSK